MWTRAELKGKAWTMLQSHYWKAFVVSLVIVIVGGGSGQLFNWRGQYSGSNYYQGGGIQVDPPTLIGLALLLVGVASIAVLGVLALRIFLGYPLEVGGRRFFLRAAQNEVDLNNLGYSFSSDRYADIVKAMLWRGFVNFLWFLLLIIPGIIKLYAFSMVPYILGDNPHIGYRRALELSENMTEGHKFEIFVLDLSFIGWYFLGALAFGIGTYFVHPYVEATRAELYLVLRKNILDSGLTTYEELCLTNPTPPEI